MHKIKVKTVTFFVEKYLPIMLLWIAIGFALYLGGSRWSELFTKANSSAAVLEALADYKILLPYAAGLAILLVIFKVSEQIGLLDKSDTDNADKFFSGLWNEFVGVTVHASCGLLVLWKVGDVSRSSLLAQSFCLMFLAWLLFKVDEPETKEAAKDAPSANQLPPQPGAQSSPTGAPTQDP